MKQYKNTPYFVTEQGQVFRKGKLKPLLPDVAKKGYCRVTLSVEGITTRLLVHQMVAEIYLPNPNLCEFVNHKDNTPTNNSKDNLEWVTHSGNMLHCHVQGRCSNLVASAKASEQKFDRSEKFFKQLLGVNFAELVNENPRNYVKYLCSCCQILCKSRTDSSVFKNDKIECRSCLRRMKI